MIWIQYPSVLAMISTINTLFMGIRKHKLIILVLTFKSATYYVYSSPDNMDRGSN